MSKLLKNSSIYLTSTLLNSIIPFALMPILTRYLTQDEYGQIAMFQTLIVAMSALVGFSVHGAASRKYYDNDITTSTLKKFNGACFQILMFSSSFVLLVTYFTEDLLAKYLNIPKEWIIFSVVIASTGFIVQIRLGQWQIRNSAKKFGFFQVCQSLFNMLLSLLFVVVFIRGAEGRIEAQLIISLLFSFLAIYLLHKDRLINFCQWSPKLINEALSFGIPLIPHVVGGFLLVFLDRFIINQELGVSDVAVYMVAVQLSSALNIIFQSFNKAYAPWLFEQLKINDIKQKINIVKMTYIYFAVVLILGALSFIIGPFVVILIAGEKYRASGSIIGWLCLGQIFNGMYLMVTNYIFYSKKTARLSMVTIFSGTVNALLLMLLIQPLGLLGASIAFTVSSFLMFLFTWAVSIKCHAMPWFSSSILNKAR